MMFVKYANIDGDSGVISYEIGVDRISVRFYSNPKIYVYSYASAGEYNVEKMKQLAEIGDGLNAYIIHYCKDKYEK